MALTYSLIIPAYNEEKIISSTLDRVYSYLLNQHKPFEILLVNDGSWDKTEIIVKEKINIYKELHLITHPQNLGKGAALTNGLKQAKGTIVVILDADLAIDLELFPKLIEALTTYDIAIASKHLPNADVTYSFSRRILSKGYSLLTRIFLDSHIHDYQCGFKAFRHFAVQRFLPFIHETGWAWDTEVLLKSQWLGLSVKEIPAKIIDIPNRQSKVRPIKATLSMLKSLYKLWKEKKDFNHIN